MRASWIGRAARPLALVAAAGVLSGASCFETEPTAPKSTLDCAKGYYEVKGACVLRPDVVTLVIQNHPGVSGFEDCPWYPSSPSSVVVNQGFRFENRTSATYTIMMRRNVQGAQSSPVTTVSGGQTSSVFSLGDVGERQYIAASCVRAGATLGILYVTAGS